MMKFVKSAVKVLSLIHIVLWIVLLIRGIIDASLYTGAGKEPLEYALERGSLTILVIACGIGAITAGMLALSVFRFLRPGRTKLRTITLGACIMDNVLLYLSVYFVFFINQDIAIIFPLLWLVCSILCCVLLSVDS